MIVGKRYAKRLQKTGEVAATLTGKAQSDGDRLKQFRTNHNDGLEIFR
jgi:hypothetical protein